MTTKTVTIRLSALRSATVDGAVMKLLAWLGDRVGPEASERTWEA